jgi:hypothetical protein
MGPIKKKYRKKIWKILILSKELSTSPATSPFTFSLDRILTKSGQSHEKGQKYLVKKSSECHFDNLFSNQKNPPFP